MGTTVNGIYLPGHLEQNWDDEVNNNFKRLGELAINVKAQGFNAQGDGVADDTGAVHGARDAAGAGGHVFFPPGTYRGAFVPLDGQVWTGAGFNKSILKAKTSATEAVLMSGLRYNEFHNLGFDGNAKASKGVVIKGSASAGSQGHLFVKCRFQNTTTGLSVESGTVTQADKNTFLSCMFQDNTTGFQVNSVNGQEQLFIGCQFDSNTTGVQATSSGSLTFLSGQFQTSTTGILIDGAVLWVNLTDVIFEGSTRDIYANGGYPQHGMTLENCVLQGTNKTIDLGTGSGGGYLTARGCRFNTGNVNVTQNDFTYWDQFNTYALGAAYACSGSNDRRWKWDLNALTMNQPAAATTGFMFAGAGAASADVNLYRSAADTLELASGDALRPASSSQLLGDSTHQWRIYHEVIATASLPAAAAAMDGTVLIEDNGTGDRNLIVYAGAQRFRIDGGAAF